MASGRMRLLRRRQLRFPRGSGNLSKIGQDHKQSFFLVVVFLTIFGIIVLAEVLFMEDSKSQGDFLYEETDSQMWETPKPLPVDGVPPLRTFHHYSRNREIRNERESKSDFERSERLQQSLRRHQEEMERLIKNISARIGLTATPKSTGKAVKASSIPFSYADEPALEFDFTLEKHSGFDARWQPVTGTINKFYVYSAYMDKRGKKPILRVIAATKTKHYDSVWCRLYSRGEEKPRVVKASVNVIRENWNLKYSACFVICPLTGAGDKVESVSVVAGEDKEATNQLPILNARTGTGSILVNSTDVGVCVKPVHFNYNKSVELLEFIELNRILGVTHFTLYNHTMSSEVSCILGHYIHEGIVEVLPWNLNIQSQVEIRTEGLFAALNDCLYRNMNAFKYLMLIDFDEFIVPHQNDTIPEMIAHIDKQKVQVGGRKINPNMTSSYSFQNAFFYLQFPDDSASVNFPPLRVLRKTKRKSKFNPQKQRSKYICNPRRVKEAGNHFIWEFSEGHNLNVPTDIGFLHHYRVCEFGGSDCINTPHTSDHTVYKYKDLLVRNVDKIVQKLSDKCQLERLQRELSGTDSGATETGKS